MAFAWLDNFTHELRKEPGYAEKTLAAYALGMRAKGSIAGVVVRVGNNCCEAARQLPAEKIYHPADAPQLPLQQCQLGDRCGCVYRPVMTYHSAKNQATENTK
jgi:hypothetical protein